MGGQQVTTHVQAKETIEAALKPISDLPGKLPDRNYLVEKVTEITDQKLEKRDGKIKSL